MSVTSDVGAARRPRAGRGRARAACRPAARSPPGTRRRPRMPSERRECGERDEHVRAVADPRDADAVERAEPLADRQRVGERLARMLVRGERVDHRDRRRLGPRLELVVRERADRERVEVAREHLRRVLERLAARELHLAPAVSVIARAAELRRSRPRTRRACASRACAKIEAERRARAGAAAAVAFSSTARSRIASTSAGTRSEIRSRSRPASETGSGDFTTSAPSPPRPRPRRRRAAARGARAARTCRRAPGAATCSCASRNGTPSRTSASAASVARSSGSAHAAASRSRSNSSPRDEHRQRAERAGDVARARRTPAACPPAGRGRRRAAGP